jgi:hypothetical protein
MAGRRRTFVRRIAGIFGRKMFGKILVRRLARVECIVVGEDIHRKEHCSDIVAQSERKADDSDFGHSLNLRGRVRGEDKQCVDLCWSVAVVVAELFVSLVGRTGNCASGNWS